MPPELLPVDLVPVAELLPADLVRAPWSCCRPPWCLAVFSLKKFS
jgi:hypothetical protein